MVPAEPFATWLKARLHEYGSVHLCELFHIGGPRVDAIVAGEVLEVPISLVDRCYTADGTTHIRAEYPEFSEAA
jgi:hypothetical protein